MKIIIHATSIIRHGHTTRHEPLPPLLGMAGTWKQAISEILSSLLFLKLSMSHQNATTL